MYEIMGRIVNLFNYHNERDAMNEINIINYSKGS